MKVFELIEKLKSFPFDLDVMVRLEGGIDHASDVSIRQAVRRGGDFTGTPTGSFIVIGEEGLKNSGDAFPVVVVE